MESQGAPQQIGSISDVMEAITGDEAWRYGFRWGPLTVARLAHVEGRGYALEIATDYTTMQVFVSEGGQQVRSYPPRRRTRAERKRRREG